MERPAPQPDSMRREDTESRRRRMFQISLVVAIPWVTTFFVLALGLVLVELHRRMLFSARRQPTVMDVQNMLSDTVLAVIIAAVGALAAGVVLAASLLRPFRELERKTRRMAAGDLTGRVRLGMGTEFVELGDAFNRMSLSLNDFFVKGCGVGTLTVDSGGVVTSISGEAAELLECEEGETSGRRLEDIFLGGEENRQFREMVIDVLERRKPSPACEITLTGRNGRQAHVKATASLLRDHRHATPGALVTLEDISSEKQVREQLRRIDRLAALSGLAAGVAHQVRNPLCSIRGFAQLMEEGAGADDAARGAADEIIQNADRINAAITRMIEALRPGTPDWNYERVDEVVARIMRGGRL